MKQSQTFTDNSDEKVARKIYSTGMGNSDDRHDLRVDLLLPVAFSMSKVGGKGSKRRKAQTEEEMVRANWERIYGKKRFHGRPSKISR